MQPCAKTAAAPIYMYWADPIMHFVDRTRLEGWGDGILILCGI